MKMKWYCISCNTGEYCILILHNKIPGIIMHVKNVKRFVCMSASGWNDFLMQKVNSSKYRTLSHMYLKVLIKYYYTILVFYCHTNTVLKPFIMRQKHKLKLHFIFSFSISLLALTHKYLRKIKMNAVVYLLLFYYSYFYLFVCYYLSCMFVSW